MSEKFDAESQDQNPEDPLKKERFEDLSRVFDEAEAVFGAEGREKTKPFLITINDRMIELNKLDPETVISPLAQWNPEGDLTEADFKYTQSPKKETVQCHRHHDLLGSNQT